MEWTRLHCLILQSINQSINLYLYQATKARIVAKLHVKKEKQTQHYNTTQILPQTDAGNGKLSRYWSVTSAADVHIYIFQ